MGWFRDSVQLILQTEYLQGKAVISMEGDFNLRETVNKEVKEYVDASCMVLVPQYFIHTLKMGMNSIERHEQRYRRRKAKREEKKRTFAPKKKKEWPQRATEIHLCTSQQRNAGKV